ncbi:CvpA family protein [Flavobacterium sp.]|uniref:CvpA family protein n=1 Tax=Flavobacterium sp. TaxID=239 RepID=UPI0037516C49
MGFIDIIFAALLVFALIRGLRNGLFVELASLVSFFIGIYIAVKFSYVVGNLLGDSISSSSKTAKVAAFVITLIVVVVAIHLLAKVFSKIASFVFLGWLDKLGGAVFAVLKTVLLLGIVLGLFQKVNINDVIISKETQNKSLLFNPILKTSEVMLPVLTDWFRDLKSKTIGKN